ncbi:hypothetical protein [Tsukamurella sp. PLM1]|uniref:hypothetical protein n=1 Tax=Tsukamurella sp. PLM1 TaxID=2929795 RepID=UPI002056FB6B|nr:hypothetical protein [Tsukamurella sp. PLM1]BDH56175.1 hypothetical protein MTP03_11140 [Tsukamurella sp. PLM1]
MLPFAAGIIFGAGSAPKLMLKVAPHWITAIGGLLGTAGALWIAWAISQHGGWPYIAPGFLVVALGFGFGVMALTHAAVYRVEPDKAGIASALLNSAQQIGVALGLAVLAGVAATVTAGSNDSGPQVLATGHSTALVVGAGVLLAAKLVGAAHAQPEGERRRSCCRSPCPDVTRQGLTARSRAAVSARR